MNKDSKVTDSKDSISVKNIYVCIAKKKRPVFFPRKGDYECLFCSLSTSYFSSINHIICLVIRKKSIYYNPSF